MTTTPEPIAVIGSSCRFPGGASSPSKLWDLLSSPRDVLRDFPKDGLNLGAFHHSNGEHHGRTDVCNKSYLLEEDSRHFDSAFFNINPAEADGMDPQQRIALEVAYESMESAGYTLKQMQGSLTSVYLGVMTADYLHIQTRDPETINRYHATGTSNSILSNRVSYVFDLRGPSLTLDTACSSSLAAVHLAVQSLRRGESKTAIALGANLIFDPAGYISESKLHMLSPKSRSAMWDASADGYARGEGVAAVMLKPLSEAIRDGDHIECIVRETGMNSDGRTPGITMPSSEAQATLIRRTYANAGLDPVKDRPQFFECHGTGTLAGDPTEARAVHSAFFPDGKPDTSKLYCGSIKTIIGHTEGCAGLAGLLKSSLALQSGVIPPNLLFNTLNPAIRPLYDCLEVPTSLVQWPDVRDGPRRVSLNSFGFGGTNVHAILEQYVPQDPGPTDSPMEIERATSPSAGWDGRFVGPLTLSAENQASLLASVKAFMGKIQQDEHLDLNQLASVAQTRRNAFKFRASFAGTRESLLSSLQSAIDTAEKSPIGKRVLSSPPDSEGFALLGIFTGQGAQWASMGRELYRSSQTYAEAIARCEDSLRDLPDSPSWSLSKELIAPESTSRVGQAEISQPLCTAIQIALIDVLAAANVHFTAAVGHSSGEIAAAYAAGILSATDAMRIAYYRGFHAKLAKGRDGMKGAMMAVGLGYEAAIAFCKQFEGRIGLAASNSPTSTTLSGDEDAIQEAKDLLDQDGTFARMLKVDTAYHSYHMLECAKPYLESLQRCKIQVNAPNDCVWVSSVYGNAEILDFEEDMQALEGPYWVDNMLKSVLFSEAVECALWRAGPFELAVEVGPHPALKGPASQTIKTALGSVMPYVAVSKRGGDDVEEMSAGLGAIWTELESLVDFDGYRKAIYGSKAYLPPMMKNLPTYPWDHSRIHWKESRPSARYRRAEASPHELLGRLTGDSVPQSLRWRNVIRLDELPWLRGHAFQGQSLFPTSAYIAMAFQAAKEIADGRPISLIEIRDFTIPRGLAVQEDHQGYESVFSVSQNTSTATDDSTYSGHFTCMTASNDASGPMETRCSGDLSIEFGSEESDVLPPVARARSGLTEVDIQEYYDSLLSIGLDYQGLFRGLTSVKRTFGYSNTTAKWSTADVGPNYTMHPGPLDVAFHSIMASFSSPLSDGLWAPYLPVEIKRLALNPNVSYGATDGEINFDIHTCLTNSTQTSFEGDVFIQGADQHTGMQMEGFLLKRVKDAKPSEDRTLYSKTVWDKDLLSSSNDLEPIEPTTDHLTLVEAIDRTSLHFIKTVFDHLKEEDAEGWKWFHKSFFSAAKYFLQLARDGKMPGVDAKWLEEDSTALVADYKEKFSGQADIELLNVVGEHLSSVLTSPDANLLEIMLQDNRWTNLYLEGRIFKPLNTAIGELVANISHRYPAANILEIGAGTGGTTNFILDKVGTAYGRYTFTDVSAGFFGNAKEKFAAHGNRMTYKVLDVENDPIDQGFTEQSYDLIIAAAVLHATPDLKKTLANARTLLKPGGYLIMSEYTCEALEMFLIMGGLEGWWLGADDGRVRGPGVSLEAWDQLLQETGFSGVDKHVSDLPDPQKHAFSIIVSQAIDNRVSKIREPLSFLDEMPLEDHLLIVGGNSLSLSRTVKGIEKFAARFADKVTTVKTIDAVQEEQVPANTSIICLAELERSTFTEQVTPERLQRLQWLFGRGKDVLWVTSGRLGENPYANLSVGLGRAIINELPQLNIQFMDVDKSDSSFDAGAVMEAFLKLKLGNATEVGSDPLLYSIESEVVVRDGYTLLPRQKLDPVRNDRINSLRRTVKRDVLLDDTTVELAYSDSALFLEATEPWLMGRSNAGRGDQSLQVQHSVSLPHSGKQPQFLCYGTVDGRKALAVSSSNVSRVSAQASILELSEKDTITTDTLRTVAAYLAAEQLKQRIEKHVTPAATLLIYDCASDVAQALATISDGMKLFFASSTRLSKGSQQVFLHSRHTAHVMKQLLPADIGLVISLSNKTQDRVQDQLRALYPITHLSSTVGASSELLKVAYSTAAGLEGNEFSGPVTSVQQLQSQPLEAGLYPAVADWTDRESPVKTIVKPLRASSLLSPDKTYVMVGLVSELGKSICRWMAENGARHIVLTSRNASIDEHWHDEMKSLGATIYVHKMDVSKPDSVRAVHKTISETLPPVAGVCNGALVLKDRLFVDMSADHVNDVLNPKVAGTVHLADMFAKPGLDFFISFSSTSSVQGNPGQCCYNAASLFQASFTQKLRSQGIPASVITLGIIPDVGYIATRGREFLEMLKPEFYHMISETDVHQIFAETISASIAGTPDQDAEVVSGVKPFIYNAATTRKPFWFNVPRLAHFVREEDATVSDSADGNANAIKVSLQVDAAANEEEAAAVVSKAFAKKIESMLQMSPGSLNEDASLLDAGLDSLLAVEIRGWFLKELQVDVPVLKTLSGDSPKTICADATKKYLSAKLRDGAPKQEEESPKIGSPAASASEDGSSPSTADSTSLSDNSGSTGDGASTQQTSAEGSVYEAEKEAPVQQREVGRTEKLSFAQSRLWFVNELYNDPTFHNTFVVYKIEGRIQIPRFRRAIAAVVGQHESLRSAFFSSPTDGQPVQALLKEPIDCFEHIPDANQERVDAEIEYLKHHQWDIANGNGLRISLISLSSNDHRLLLGYHHLVMDGVGMYIFLRDLHAIYTGKGASGPGTQYLDLTVADRELFTTGGMDKKISFWRSEFASPLEPLPLLPIASVKNRFTPEVYVNHEARLDLGPTLAKQLKSVGQSLNVTPFYIHTAVIQLLFNRLLGLKDICIGATDANRNDTNRDVIGFFLNMLPLRFHLSEETSTFPDLVSKTGAKYRSAQENAGVPFEQIVDNANIARDTTCTPLFQVAINYRQGNFFNIPMGNAKMDCITTVEAKSPFDIVFCITPADDTCWVQVITRADIYSSEATQQILEMYKNLLDEIVEDKTKKLEEYSLWDGGKIEDALKVGCAKEQDFGWPATLSECFDVVARTNAERTALVDETRSLTYAELCGERDRVASAVQGRLSGLAPGEAVGVFVEPSANWAIGMLAILRLGGVYVPLDCCLPNERLAAIIGVSQPRLIVHDKSTAERVQSLSKFTNDLPTLNIDDDPETATPSTLPNSERPNERTFILFTSGSTGVPKGISLSQTGIINYIASKASLLNLGQEIVLQQSALGFDMSLAQAFQALARGGILAIASQQTRGDPLALSRFMTKHDVTFTIGTPTEYQMLIRYGDETLLSSASTWRNATSGGEAVSEDLKRAFRSLAKPPVFTDCYGPTEISCCATMRIVDLHSSSSSMPGSVGKANPNTSIYILDRDGHTLPTGVPGEIAIGGSGVALGYLDAEQSAKSFIPKPSSSGSKMYKTGDFGCLQPDGNLIFLGRMQGDTTVKLRGGLRVDLEDVAAAIRKSSGEKILDAVVTVRGEEPAFLVAHVVPAQDVDASQKALKGLMASLPLPRYMKPSVVVPLDRLPMSTNGKVDRKKIAALPLPDDEGDQTGSRQLTLAEGELKLLWTKVLPPNSSTLMAESDFFDVGGTSILLIKLQGAIKLSMGMEVGLHDLYNASTLASMAALVSARKENYTPPCIDWEAETSLPSGLDISTSDDLVDSNVQDGLEILLTGSTGFLGGAILTSLLANPAINKIHCIAIDPDVLSSHKTDPRITLYPGSLSEPRLGLDQSTFTHLFSAIHRIIHAGALGHCLNNYTALRKPNVHSTTTLAVSALPRRIPVHYISSPRVTLLYPSSSAATPPISVSRYAPRKDGSEGFTAAKWASESILENFAEKTELPVTIHRPCNVVGTEAPLEDALNALLRYCKLLRVVPAVGSLDIKGFFDFREVSSVAEDITAAVISTPSSAGGNEVAFRHYSSGVRVPPEDFRAYMQQITGEEMSEVPLGEWLKLAREKGMEDIIVSYLEAVVEKGQTLVYPFMGASL